jgi:predicted TIM-barrel fold metal-dependent hydrolase
VEAKRPPPSPLPLPLPPRITRPIHPPSPLSFPLLASNGLVFDLHCNWFQLADAALYLARHGATTTVVLDHLGCVKLGTGSADEDAARIREWKAGMAALAANPNVNVKISGLEYILAGWMVPGSAERTVIAGLVDFVVATFSPARCLVASNWPVDLAMGKAPMPVLYEALHDVLAAHSHADRVAMFHGTATRVYGMDKL